MLKGKSFVFKGHFYVETVWKCPSGERYELGIAKACYKKNKNWHLAASLKVFLAKIVSLLMSLSAKFCVCVFCLL